MPHLLAANLSALPTWALVTLTAVLTLAILASLWYVVLLILRSLAGRQVSFLRFSFFCLGAIVMLFLSAAVLSALSSRLAKSPAPTPSAPAPA